MVWFFDIPGSRRVTYATKAQAEAVWIGWGYPAQVLKKRKPREDDKPFK